MKNKQEKPTSYLNAGEEILPILEEPAVVMRSINRLPASFSNYSYTKFQKVADKAPFTLAEWASILHLSERTLQRYAKENKPFEGIYVDRILQIEKLVDMGLDVFDSPKALYGWLQKEKLLMGEIVTFECLYYTDGINMLFDQLGRIQQGVYS